MHRRLAQPIEALVARLVWDVKRLSALAAGEAEGPEITDRAVLQARASQRNKLRAQAAALGVPWGQMRVQQKS